MVPLVAFPRIVEHYAPHFAAVFSPAALIQFKRYISGLLVSENKTVEGINRLFVLESRHQSSLNRLLTASPFTLPALNHARLALLQIMEDRHGKAATIITSQLPVSKWHEYIGDPTLADAILDRITHKAHRMELKGESMRRKQSVITDK